MEEEFYATIKLISGEEVMSKVCPCDEHDRIILILESPVLVKNINLSRFGIKGMQLEPWIKMSSDNMFLLDMEKVITMSEILDESILKVYKKFIKESARFNKKETCRSKITKEMGYVSSVEDFKSNLEKLFKES